MQNIVRRNTISEDVKKEIFRLHEMGKPSVEIASDLALNSRVVTYHLNTNGYKPIRRTTAPEYGSDFGVEKMTVARDFLRLDDRDMENFYREMTNGYSIPWDPEKYIGSAPATERGFVLPEELAVAMVVKGVSAEPAYETSWRAVSQFGFRSFVIDNNLDPDERDVFYIMDDMGLVEQRSEESLLMDGHIWRSHYWVMPLSKIDALNNLAAEYMEDQAEGSMDEWEVYRDDDMWDRAARHIV